MGIFTTNENIVFGFDLGVASVGWSVLDIVNKNIIDKGVVEFSQAEKAEERRKSRALRRRYKRRKHRLERLEQLYKSYHLGVKPIQDTYLLEKRQRALREQVQLQDIVNILGYYARHRGYIAFEDGENEVRENTFISNLRKEGLYGCEIQGRCKQQFGEYRGNDYPLLHTDYQKELEAIMATQKLYYPEILTDAFIKDATEIIDSKREFWEGPGAPRENALTPYGRYTDIEDLKNYQKDSTYNKYLFEKLIGDCAVYTGEKKATAYNFYAECFNFYNDLVNLRFRWIDIEEGYTHHFEKVDQDYVKLTSKAIQMIQEYIIPMNSVAIKDVLKKLVGISTFTGAKLDKDQKPQIATFNTYRSLRKKLGEQRFNLLTMDMACYNEALYIIQVAPNTQSRKELLEKRLANKFRYLIQANKAEKKVVEELVNTLSEVTLVAKYHSFSERALKNYLVYMQESNNNASYVERNYEEELGADQWKNQVRGYLNENIQKGELKYLTDKYIENLVASPQVKKTLRKAIKVLNKLFNKYGYPKAVCIETTTSLLSEEKQKEYEKKTLTNQQKRKGATTKIKALGYEATDTNIDKYLILQETDFKCAYCNQPINLSNVEVEHILPKSITGDNSFDNKTASCTNCNQAKNNRSPYGFLLPKGTYTTYKERVIKNKNLTYKKKQYFLFEGELNKFEKKFKNRNLNDTAYATQEFANQINLFKEAYKHYNGGQPLEIEVLKVPGQFTGAIRGKQKLVKDRDYRYHHAVDATIVAHIYTMPIGQLMRLIQNYPNQYWRHTQMDKYRDKIWDELYVTPKIKKQLEQTDFANTRFSREVKKNPQGKLFNQNINKVIEKEDGYKKVDQIDNIYELDKKKVADLEKMLRGEDKKHLFCVEYNPKLTQKLLEIIQQYPYEKMNPFKRYCIETNKEEVTMDTFNPMIHGIRTSEHPSAPVVIKLRYYGSVTEPFLVKKKSIDKKEHTLLMYHSLKQVCTRIYHNPEKDKLVFLPIYANCMDMKTKIINQNSSYYKQLYKTLIGEQKVNHMMDIYNNEYVRFLVKGKSYEGFIQGYHKTLNKIEVKECKSSITTSTTAIQKIHLDILGLYNLNV